MSKIKFNFNIKPFVGKAGSLAKQCAQGAMKTVKNKEFQKGAVTVLVPSGISTFFLIRKYKKEVAEKDTLYMKKLQKHNAIIKELSEDAEISKERQDRLLQYDFKLKSEMGSLETEIEMLKKKIADLEEGKK